MPKRNTSNAPQRRRKDLTDDDRWNAFVSRDSSLAGAFFMSVRTTGVYCRAGCPARTPNRSNITFYETADQAEAAGFRPCKRCKPREAPDLQHRQVIAQACRSIETADDTLKLADLAEAAGLSQFHFHRLFKSLVGVTPKAYAVAHRRQRVRHNLPRSSTVTKAVHDSGFNSNGRFYADSNASLGMTPARYRDGGAGTEILYALADCALGRILVAASDKGVCAIFLGDDDARLIGELKREFPNAELAEGSRPFEKLMRKAVALADAPSKPSDLPLDIRGTAFQHRVWQALREIPAGETRTYAEIAKAIGSPKAVRAVGSACGANNISIAIPCHRVVRSDGTFPHANYRWGAERKKALIETEAKKRKG